MSTGKEIERRQKEDDAEFELLDLTDKGWLKKMFGDLTKASVAKQIAVGGASGMCAGYLTAKIGRAAAMAVGGSLLLMQIAHHQGYIEVNWGKLERKMKKVKKTARKDAEKLLPHLADEISHLASNNMFLVGSFVGGLLLGFSM